jgi:hypothetical protein
MVLQPKNSTFHNISSVYVPPSLVRLFYKLRLKEFSRDGAISVDH